eukprot:GHVU01211968.1.p6 GENE.GHVU01211968.1~~GHVU01211968.1.p6  ORF type:complete len:134 (-),score=19.03 GHVU01211968.1:1843-2244(-)
MGRRLARHHHVPMQQYRLLEWEWGGARGPVRVAVFEGLSSPLRATDYLRHITIYIRRQSSTEEEDVVGRTGEGLLWHSLQPQSSSLGQCGPLVDNRGARAGDRLLTDFLSSQREQQQQHQQHQSPPGQLRESD